MINDIIISIIFNPNNELLGFEIKSKMPDDVLQATLSIILTMLENKTVAELKENTITMHKEK